MTKFSFPKTFSALLHSQQKSIKKKLPFHIYRRGMSKIRIITLNKFLKLVLATSANRDAEGLPPFTWPSPPTWWWSVESLQDHEQRGHCRTTEFVLLFKASHAPWLRCQVGRFPISKKKKTTKLMAYLLKVSKSLDSLSIIHHFTKVSYNWIVTSNVPYQFH